MQSLIIFYSIVVRSMLVNIPRTTFPKVFDLSSD